MSDKRLKANVVAERLRESGALLAEPVLFSDESLYRTLSSYGWEWDGQEWKPWA
jgi:hypothetical protein